MLIMKKLTRQERKLNHTEGGDLADVRAIDTGTEGPGYKGTCPPKFSKNCSPGSGCPSPQSWGR